MEIERVFTKAEMLQAAREGSELVKQSDIKLNKAKIEIIAKVIEHPVDFILKHDIGFNIKVKTCHEKDIERLNILIAIFYKDDNKDATDLAFKKIMDFSIKDIIAHGTLERELSKSTFDKYIDFKWVDTPSSVSYNIKLDGKKSYRCFAHDNIDGSFKNRNHIIHEDAGSAWNCLLTTKLKHFKYGFIYRENLTI